MKSKIKIAVIAISVIITSNLYSQISSSPDNSVNAISGASNKIPSGIDNDGGWSSTNAYWASPLIYRSKRESNGVFPFNEYGELMIQGTSHGRNYNKGISLLTWDGLNSIAQIRMRINAEGNVGIGTNGPNEKLHLSSDEGTKIKVVTTSTTGSTGILFQGKRTTGLNSSHYLGTDGVSHYNFKINADENLKLQTNGTDKMIISSAGRVGIGVPNPSSKLQLMNGNDGISFDASDDWVGVGFNRSVKTGEIFDTAKSGWQFTARDDRFSLEGYNGAFSNLLNVLKNGHVGIGEQNPDSKLHIKGSTSTYSTIENTGGNSKMILGAVTNRNIIYSRKLDNTPQILKLQVSSENDFVVNTDGKIGIGTNTMGNHKLAVEGSIGAREIKVEAFPNWSDFVFYDDYQLPTLTEVENHIKAKGHLKDIPSAKEVEKNGFYLGEMDAKLLQKIEELTLYTIEQEKKIEDLKKYKTQLDSQAKEIKELKSLLKKVLELNKNN
ncbi:hypothetical protein SAMN04489761_2675 [Tenacibaculum sp. MAR_2009_124]|uniref:hypothetical protein n=1 Tax=Tenacibaculum sp. MAR_2009_124 TaxID=1250059 RepID=UPI000898A6BC|nr:hypothetical protein [Tenacibaculum sp. MAR_2009_124]SEC32275.1 hypothetical protein SAMN04489761_2675 [Tenacibaculum sp. MAR_2009_124]